MQNRQLESSSASSKAAAGPEPMKTSGNFTNGLVKRLVKTFLHDEQLRKVGFRNNEDDVFAKKLGFGMYQGIHKRVSALTGEIRNKPVVLFSARKDKSLQTKVLEHKERRTMLRLSKRKPRRVRKQILRQSLLNAKYESFDALRGAWLKIARRKWREVEGVQFERELEKLAAKEKAQRDFVRSVGLLGANLKVLRKAGSAMKESHEGTVIFVGKNVFYVLSKSNVLEQVPLEGTKVQLEGSRSFQFWTDSFL